MAGDVVVERVVASVVLPLRSAVLRPGRPLDAARLDVDDLPDTATFAAIDRRATGTGATVGRNPGTATEPGTVVGTALVYPAACPWVPTARGWRLRGMATAPGRRNAGIGTRLVKVVVERGRLEILEASHGRCALSSRHCDASSAAPLRRACSRVTSTARFWSSNSDGSERARSISANERSMSSTRSGVVFSRNSPSGRDLPAPHRRGT